MIGKTILHYTVTGELGAGGMGRVYLARDTRIDRLVALKFLGADLTADRAANARLVREAVAAARLSHPNIVGIYTIERSEGQAFLVQEYVDGEDLGRRIARGLLGTDEILRCARDLTAGLSHAHARGVLHRDLKPGNILVTRDGGYKIADFGLARVRDLSTLTQADVMLGTLPYLAPELTRGDRGDVRCDLFSLGAVFYEAMTGRRAVGGATAAEVLYTLLNKEPIPPEISDPRLARLTGVTMNLLAKSPNQRPRSAAMVAEMLDSGGLEGKGGVDQSATAARAEDRSRYSAPSQHVPRRLGPLSVLLGAAAVSLVAIAGIVLALRHGRDRNASEVAPPVAVLSFDNLTDPEDRDHMGAISGNLLLTSLAQAKRLNVLSAERMLDIMRGVARRGERLDRGVAVKAAKRAGVARLVSGNILQTSPTIIVTAEVSEVSSGRIVEAARIEGLPGQSVFQVVDALSARLVQNAFAEESRTPWLPVAVRSSGDLDAYRSYVDGLENLSRGNLTRAEGLFFAAVHRDSTFAQAYYELAIVQWWLRKPSDSYATLRKVFGLEDRLSDVEKDLAHSMVYIVRHDWGKARAPFERLAKKYPNDKRVLFGLLQARDAVGDLKGKEEAARRILEIDPGFVPAGYLLGYALLQMDRSSDAISVAREMMRRNPETMLMIRIAFDGYLDRGDGDSALAVAQERPLPKSTYAREAAKLLLINRDSIPDPRFWNRGNTLTPWQVRDDSLGVLYLSALRRGRFREGIRLARDAWRIVPLTGAPAGPTIPLASGVNAAAGAGDVKLAVAWSDSITSRVSRWGGSAYDFTTLMMDIEYRFDLGLNAVATSRLNEVPSSEGRYGEDSWFLNYNRALRASAEERHEEALDFLQRGKSSGWIALRRGMWWLQRVRIEMKLGKLDDALSDIDLLMRTPTIMPDDAVRLHLYRGQVLERLHRSTEARASYREFLKLWKDADPGTPEVATARAALARLI